MKLFSYLSRHRIAVLLIFALLVGQAICDLALPRFTSDLVDVGIVQSGVEHAAPEALTADSRELADVLLSPDERALLDRAYRADGQGVYRLTDEGRAERAALDDALGPVLMLAHAPAAQRQRVDQVVDQVRAGSLDADRARLMVRQALGASGADPSIERAAVLSAAGAELQAAGVSLDDTRMAYLLRTGGVMMGFVLASGALSVLVGLVAARTGARIGHDLRQQLFERVTAFSEADVQSFSVASLITRGTNDIQQIQNMTVMLLRMVLYAPILAVGGMIMVARTDLSLSWIIGLAIACVLAVGVVLMALVVPRFKLMQKLIDRVNLVAREMITGLPVVRAFGRQGHEQARFDEASAALMRTQLFTSRALAFMMPTMMLVMSGATVLIMAFGSEAVDAGSIQPGSLIAFISYAMVIVMSFLMLGMLGFVLPRGQVAGTRIDEVLSHAVSVADAPDALAGAFCPQEGARIEFRNVSFTYPDSDRPALRDASFVAEPGSTTAIIGSTGSGKSTVISLIERFYDVSEGAVLVDGVDVRRVRLSELRAQLGYVPQRAYLFSGTMASNIAGQVSGSDDPDPDLGPDPGLDSDSGGDGPGPVPDAAADLPRVREAARIAQAHDFIQAREGGYASEVAQGGSNVSGGQRQRIAIARALARDARALLFDDSFSALDYRTDAALRRALADRRAGVTLLIVAQRVATVLNADRIVVLDEGRVVGVGTHAQLMEDCQAYREIALSQLSADEMRGGRHE
ncbi:ABC transporter ATP-binding protein [Eggerthellaceae bacterium zg-1084]|uniref:ABC transporter ATP-binding protein n=1 Tax=Berryella wangjianweii TaxID=2734634 RepID=UPI001551E717|nr:ABC transporter ATP-binding protein [Berryella wangjianweii]NPD31577.1 ABC transporter ATP-binding protein [Berryella wangjianweii]